MKLNNPNPSNVLKTLTEGLGPGVSHLHNTINAIMKKSAFISGVSKYHVYWDVWKLLIRENLLLNEGVWL